MAAVAVALPAGQKSCANHLSYAYTGKESSPLGLGLCAEAEEMGTVKEGRDKNMWMVGMKAGKKVWARIPNHTVKKEAPVMAVGAAETEGALAVAVAVALEAAVVPLEGAAVPAAAAVPVEGAAKKKKAPKRAAAVEVEGAEGKKPKKKRAAAADNDDGSSTGSEKKKRAPSAYNLFVRDQMAALKLSEPGLQQKEYLTKAVGLWNTQKKGGAPPAAEVAAEVAAEEATEAPVIEAGAEAVEA